MRALALDLHSQPSHSHLTDTRRHAATHANSQPSHRHSQPSRRHSQPSHSTDHSHWMLVSAACHATSTLLASHQHSPYTPHNAHPHRTMRLVLSIQENTLTILQSRHLMHSHAFTSTNRTAHMNQSPPRTASRFHPRQTVVLVPDTRHGRSLAIARHAVLLAVARHVHRHLAFHRT